MLRAAERLKLVTAHKDEVIPAAPLAGRQLGRDRGDDLVDQARRAVTAGYLHGLQVEQQVARARGTRRNQAGQQVAGKPSQPTG